MKQFKVKRQKALGIEARFDAIKPRPPGPTKLTDKEKDRVRKTWGPEMSGFMIKAIEADMRKLVCKNKTEYKRRLAKWKKDRKTALDKQKAEMKRQADDDRNRYYACGLCGTEAWADSRMGSVDVISSCTHNDRYIQQRDRRQEYSNQNDQRDYR